jgi:hypothetical protein
MMDTETLKRIESGIANGDTTNWDVQRLIMEVRLLHKIIDSLQADNAMMSAALDELSEAGNYYANIDSPITWGGSAEDTPWEFAQSVKDKLERGE